MEEWDTCGIESSHGVQPDTLAAHGRERPALESSGSKAARQTEDHLRRAVRAAEHRPLIAGLAGFARLQPATLGVTDGVTSTHPRHFRAVSYAKNPLDSPLLARDASGQFQGVGSGSPSTKAVSGVVRVRPRRCGPIQPDGQRFCCAHRWLLLQGFDHDAELATRCRPALRVAVPLAVAETAEARRRAEDGDGDHLRGSAARRAVRDCSAGCGHAVLAQLPLRRARGRP